MSLPVNGVCSLMPTVQCNGADLYYEEQGAGPPIVFLHGAFAGLRYFEPQLAELSEEFRPVAFDLRGHGRSEKTETGHTLPRHARDLRAFLERLDLTDGVVVGWSMGALVSWEYIDRVGTEEIDALVDIDMEPSPFQRADYEFGTYTIAGMQEALDEIQSNPLKRTGASREACSRTPVAGTPEHDVRRRNPNATVGTGLDALGDDARSPRRTPEIDVPTLVCAGADEKWRGVDNVKYAADLIPDARFELFEQSGHCLSVEEPERFDRVLTEFLRSL